MYFREFQGVRVAALAAAVPDNHEQIMRYAGQFSEAKIRRFCKSTGVRERYHSVGVGTTTSDLCVAAAEEIFRRTGIDKNSIGSLIFLSQTPDYCNPATSCVMQYRLGLEDCGLVYDSNIGCTGFPIGIQMACANLSPECRRVLLLLGESTPDFLHMDKDDLLFGDCGIAAILERTDKETQPVRVGIRTIGKDYKALIAPYGMMRHPLRSFYEERGAEDTVAYINKTLMEGMDVFTFSIKEAPKGAKEFLEHFSCTMEDYDLFSIHQANKMIVTDVAKRIEAPAEKVLWTLDRYGNTRGAGTALNICDYAERENVHSGSRRILNLAFGVGLSIALADFEMDMSGVMPIVKTSEVFDDGIDNFSYFTADQEGD